MANSILCGKYSFGFNGQEKETEINQSITSAEFWMYDGRLGRRWNREPLIAKYPNLSSYTCFQNNPILFSDPNGQEVVWTGFNGNYKGLIKALIKTETYQTVFIRFIKNQDNVFITPSADYSYYGKADPYRGANGYNLFIGANGYLINGELIVDPTFMAKVITHEGLHHRYGMAIKEGKQSDYPTLDKQMKIEATPGSQNSQGTPEGYHGEHETMAEGNIDLMVKGMREFDVNYGTTHSNDWYNAMAWRGSLSEKTNAYQNLDPTVKAKYDAIINNENLYENYLAAKATYNGNKTSANKQSMENAYKAINQKLFKKTRKAN